MRGWSRATAGLLALALATILAVMATAPAAARPELQLGAAASLSPVLHEVKATFEAAYDATLVFHFASTGTLRQQVERGAPVDVLLAIASPHTQRLIEQGLAVAGGEFPATNRLYLVRAKGRSWPASWDDLREASLGKVPPSVRIAIGDPSHVPVGLYAKTALESDGQWDGLRSRLVLANDARQLASYVAMGAVDAAIIYESDYESKTMEKVADVPQHLYPQIRYSMLVVKRHRPEEQGRALERLLEFLQSETMRDILAARGFGVSP